MGKARVGLPTFYFLVSVSISCVFILSSSKSFGALWTESGNWVQSNWEVLLHYFDRDEFSLYIYGINLWTFVLYWVVGSIYLLVDLFGWPKWMLTYKVQPGVNEPVDLNRLPAVIGRVLFNQIVVGFSFAVVGFHVMKYQGQTPPVEVLPTFRRLTMDIAVCIAVQEVAAYYTHRMFHHRWLYKHTHKIHHEWTAPIALTAVSNHPLDHLIGNILPAVLGIALMNSHLFTSWVWLSWATLRTLSDHSGYHLPGFPSPQSHDFHHLKFTECFGVWGVVDYLHGTDHLFRLRLSNKQKQTK